MNKIYKYGVLLLTALYMVACKEDEIIVPKVDEIISDRVVVIEDFTGVKCVNCPKATSEIASLINRYPDNIVTIAYHTDNLGSPIETPVEFKSKYDFRTPDGEILENNMGSFLGKPAVGLNRRVFNGQEDFILTNTSVLGNLDSELRSIPKAKISIDNSYDATSRKLTCTVTIDPQSVTAGDIRLHVVLTESSIIDSQENTDGYVKDYEHNHVFRTMLSKVDGDGLGSSLTPGSLITRTYEFTLPPEAGWWVAENCNIVAFLSDFSQKYYSVGYVLQGAEAHLVD